jgi:peroxiredoxin
MPSLQPPVCEFGKKALNFNLLGVDEQYWTLQKCMGERGLLIMFISNHCPYVQAIRNKLVRDTRDLIALGVKSVAIMPNDTITYPDDSIENMSLISKEFSFPFPYLLDETQEVAKAYDAICTPDFFGYNAELELQYRGRLDAAGPGSTDDTQTRELFEAMKLVAETGRGPEQQIASMGCSIKWR